MRWHAQSLFHTQVTESCESRDSPSNPPKRHSYGTPPCGPPGISVGIHFSVSSTWHDTSFIFCSQRGLPASTPPKVAWQNRAICFQACGWRNQGETRLCILVGNFQMETRSLSEYFIIQLHFVIQLAHFLPSKQRDLHRVHLSVSFYSVHLFKWREEQHVPCTKLFGTF